MNNKQPVKFCFGTDATYQTINKDPNTIYFIIDNSGGGRLYVGEQSYNVEVVNSLNLTPDSVHTAPSVAAVSTGLNRKVNKCNIITDTTSTNLPTSLTLETDTEYRYIGLTATTTRNLVLSIPDFTGYQFYSSIVASTINFAGTVAEFVQLSPSSTVQVIRFLNGDVDLSDKNVAELLFFSNGIDICCIGTGYNTNA